MPCGFSRTPIYALERSMKEILIELKKINQRMDSAGIPPAPPDEEDES